MLAKLAGYTPIWVTPNHLSQFRIYVTPFVFGAYFAHPLLCLFLYLLACASDWLDGHLARTRGLISEEGKQLDEQADKLLAVSTSLLFAVTIGGRLLDFEWSPLLLFCTGIILIRDGAVTRMRMTWPERAKRIPSLRSAKWKTGLLMAGFALVILGGTPHPWFIYAAYVGAGVVSVSALLAIWSGCWYAILFAGWKG